MYSTVFPPSVNQKLILIHREENKPGATRISTCSNCLSILTLKCHLEDLPTVRPLQGIFSFITKAMGCKYRIGA